MSPAILLVVNNWSELVESSNQARCCEARVSDDHSRGQLATGSAFEMSQGSTKPIFSMVYGSIAKRPFTDEELHKLLIMAQSNNRHVGITGYLHHKKGHFFQYLEGEQEHVLRLANLIATDERHEVVRTIHLGHETERVFSNWSMRLVGDEELVGLEGIVDLLLCRGENSYDDSTLRPILITLGERIAKHLQGGLPPEAPSQPALNLRIESANAMQLGGVPLSPES